jgi:hypothetical protein
MQEQAGGECSWPTPPSIGTGYLRRVPVKLKQRPLLVSAVAFIVNTGTDSFSNWGGRLEGWVGKEDGCGGQRSGGLEAEKAEFMPHQEKGDLYTYRSEPKICRENNM